MGNLKVFADLLNCAYDLDILHFQNSQPEVMHDLEEGTNRVVSKVVKHACYIMTNDGDVEISIKHKIEYGKEGKKLSYTSKFKSNLRNIEDTLLQDLIKTQLETEAFLEYGDTTGIDFECYAQ